MHQEPNPSAETMTCLDPAVFARIWSRVMPDEAQCPIVIHQSLPAPEVAQQQETKQSGRDSCENPPPTSAQQGAPADTPSCAQQPLLAQLIDDLSVGLYLAKQQPRHNSQLEALTRLPKLYQTALRQLKAAYFLQEGTYYNAKPAPRPASPTQLHAVREQYLWECAWQTTCTQAAAQLCEPILQELCHELALAAKAHTQQVQVGLAAVF